MADSDEFKTEISDLAELGMKLSDQSTDLGHRLAYFVIGVQTVLCGYILYNFEKFSKIHFIPYFFLETGITIIFGLIWLTLYTYQVHFAAQGLLIQKEYFRWMRAKSLDPNLPANFDFKEEFKKENPGFLEKGIKQLDKSQSKIWLFFQIVFNFLFVAGTIICFIWLAVAGFLYLKTSATPG